MIIIFSRNGVPVRLTDERWDHIVRRHAAMTRQQERVVETVTEPDLIRRGMHGEWLAVRFYRQTPLTSKYLVVAYRETTADDGFIVTAYYARRLSSRSETVWTR